MSKNFEVLTKLGVSLERQKDIEDGKVTIDDAVNEVVTRISTTQEQLFAKDWAQKNAENIKKDANVGTYNRIQGLLEKAFGDYGIKAEEFKTLEKPTDAMIEKLASLMREKIDHSAKELKELNEKLKQGAPDQATLVALQKQLEEEKAKAAQIEELQKQLKEQPEVLKKQFKREQWKETQISEAIKKIPNLIAPEKVIRYALQAEGIDFEVEEAENGFTAIAKKGDQKLTKPNNGGIFTNIEEYISSFVAATDGFIRKSGEVMPQANPQNPQSNTNADDKKPKYTPPTIQTY